MTDHRLDALIHIAMAGKTKVPIEIFCQKKLSEKDIVLGEATEEQVCLHALYHELHQEFLVEESRYFNAWGHPGETEAVLEKETLAAQRRDQVGKLLAESLSTTFTGYRFQATENEGTSDCIPGNFSFIEGSGKKRHVVYHEAS